MESGTVLREIDNVMMGKIMKERREGIGMKVGGIKICHI